MCNLNGLAPTSAPAFGKIVRKAFPSLKCSRKGPRGQTKHHYKDLVERTATTGPHAITEMDYTLPEPSPSFLASLQQHSHKHKPQLKRSNSYHACGNHNLTSSINGFGRSSSNSLASLEEEQEEEEDSSSSGPPSQTSGHPYYQFTPGDTGSASSSIVDLLGSFEGLDMDSKRARKKRSISFEDSVDNRGFPFTSSSPSSNVFSNWSSDGSSSDGYLDFEESSSSSSSCSSSSPFRSSFSNGSYVDQHLPYHQHGSSPFHSFGFGSSGSALLHRNIGWYSQNSIPEEEGNPSIPFHDAPYISPPSSARRELTVESPIPPSHLSSNSFDDTTPYPTSHQVQQWNYGYYSPPPSSAYYSRPQLQQHPTHLPPHSSYYNHPSFPQPSASSARNGRQKDPPYVSESFSSHPHSPHHTPQYPQYPMLPSSHYSRYCPPTPSSSSTPLNGSNSAPPAFPLAPASPASSSSSASPPLGRVGLPISASSFRPTCPDITMSVSQDLPEGLRSAAQRFASQYQTHWRQLFDALLYDLESAASLLHSFWSSAASLHPLFEQESIYCQILDVDREAYGILSDLIMANPMRLRVDTLCTWCKDVAQLFPSFVERAVRETLPPFLAERKVRQAKSFVTTLVNRADFLSYLDVHPSLHDRTRDRSLSQ
ncbi:hypothetical protein QOT17_014066 [Balamuthia mandrillaris]